MCPAVDVKALWVHVVLHLPAPSCSTFIPRSHGGIISEQRLTVRCDILITNVCWPRLSGSGALVGPSWDMVFSVCQNNHEREQLPPAFFSCPGYSTPIRNETKRGQVVPKRGTSHPHFAEATKNTPRASKSKRGTCSHAIFYHSRSPAVHQHEL